MFLGCVGLDSLALLSPHCELAPDAFLQCPAIASLVFGLKVVPPGLFVASTLEAVTFDTGVRGVASRAFEGSTALVTMRFAVGTKRIGAWAFAGCVKQREVVLPESIRTLGEEAFRGCLALPAVSITFPNIAQGTFRGCSRLSTVTLGPAVVELGDRALESCTALAGLSFPRSVQGSELARSATAFSSNACFLPAPRARSTRQHLRTAERVQRLAD